MPQLQGLARQPCNATQLASDGFSDHAQPAGAPPCNSGKSRKPFQARKGPTQHNHFTAEMDLAAAGLLGQPLKPADAVDKPASSSGKQLQCGPVWPFRNKRALQQQQHQPQQPAVQSVGELQEQQLQQQLVVELSPQGQDPWKQQDRQVQQQQQQACSSEGLSPGAKEALVLAGLLSQEQVSAFFAAALCCHVM